MLLQDGEDKLKILESFEDSQSRGREFKSLLIGRNDCLVVKAEDDKLLSIEEHSYRIHQIF